MWEETALSWFRENQIKSLQKQEQTERETGSATRNRQTHACVQNVKPERSETKSEAEI